MKLTRHFLLRRKLDPPPPWDPNQDPLKYDSTPTEDLVMLGAIVVGKCAPQMGVDGALIVGTMAERLRKADELLKLITEGLRMGYPADQILAQDGRAMQLAREFIHGTKADDVARPGDGAEESGEGEKGG